jgi:hypothetical protein
MYLMYCPSGKYSGIYSLQNTAIELALLEISSRDLIVLVETYVLIWPVKSFILIACLFAVPIVVSFFCIEYWLISEEATS